MNATTSAGGPGTTPLNAPTYQPRHRPTLARSLAGLVLVGAVSAVGGFGTHAEAAQASQPAAPAVWQDPALVTLARQAAATQRARQRAVDALARRTASQEASAEGLVARETAARAEAERLTAELPELEAAVTRLKAQRDEVRAEMRAARADARAAKKQADWKSKREADRRAEAAKGRLKTVWGALWKAGRVYEAAAKARAGATWRAKDAAKRAPAAAAKVARTRAELESQQVALASAKAWASTAAALAAGGVGPAALTAEAVEGLDVDARGLALAQCVHGLRNARGEVPGEDVQAACGRARAKHASAARHLAVALSHAGRAGQEALVMLAARLRFEDDDVDGQLAVATALLKAEAPKLALRPLRQAAKATDRRAHRGRKVEALMRLVDAYVMLGSPRRALGVLAELDKAAPGDVAIAWRRARLLAELGDTSRASKVLGTFVHAGPVRKQDPRFGRCGAARVRLELPTATPALGATPSRAAGLVWLAARARAEGDLDGAGQHLERARGLAPEDPEVLLYGALHRLDLEDAAAALPLAEAAAKAWPKGRALGAMPVVLGLARLGVGDAGGAVRALDRAPAGDWDAGLARAVALARAERAADSAAALTGLAESAGDDAVKVATVAHVTAALAVERADLAGAREALEGAPTDGASPEAWALRGEVALGAEDAKAARGHYERALKAAPGYVDARIGLGRALGKLGDAAGAVKMLEVAVAIDPTCAEAHLQLGTALGEVGDTAGEAREYRKAEALRGRALAKSAAAEGDDAPTTVRRVAVVRFLNASEDPEHEWLSMGIAEAVSTDLQRLTKLGVVERGQVAALMREIKFSSLDFVDDQTAPKIGSVLGVDALVVGSFQVVEGDDGKKVRLLGRLVDLGTRRVLETGQAEGKLSDVFDLQRRLAIDLVDDWAEVGAKDKQRVLAAAGANEEALKSLALTRQKMLAGDKAGAEEAFRKAMDASPEFVARVEDLREAYDEASARLAVVPFRNLSGDEELAWLGEGLALSLGTDMRKIGLSVVERTRIAQVLKERKMTLVLDRSKAREVGELVGASVILLGSFQSFEGQLVIDARMVQVATGAVLLTERVQGPQDTALELQAALAKAIAETLEVQVSPEELAALAQDKPELDDFKEGVLKDRLFVITKPAERGSEFGDGPVAAADMPPGESGAGGSSSPYIAPIAVGVTGLAVGIVGGVLFGLGEARLSERERALSDYRLAVEPASMDQYFADAEAAGDEANALRIGSYVAFGVAAAALAYSAWALIDASGAPDTEGRVDVLGDGSGQTIPGPPSVTLSPLLGGGTVGLGFGARF